MASLTAQRSQFWLVAIKAIHTLIWIVIVACIFTIWIAAGFDHFLIALFSIGIVSIDVVIIWLNGGHCPLTRVVRSLAGEAFDGSDIYLPSWLALRTKWIFGSLYAAGIGFTLWRMFGRPI